MKTRLLLLCLAFLALPAGAADLITRWLVFTNAPIGNTNSVTLNASTRTYTNTVSGSPGTLIQETNSIGWSATNTANQLTTYRVSFAHLITLGSNYVAVRGAVGENLTLSINTCCFGYVTNSTQSVAVPTIGVRVPITAEVASNQTIVASLLAKGISDSSTNSFATNSVALSNAVIKGASPLQTIASPIQFFGRASVNSNFFATNGFTSALTNVNPVSSNATVYGGFKSYGTGNSFQAGSNAQALTALSVALGPNSIATNTDATALGNATTATNKSTAVGRRAEASDGSLALGYQADALYLQSTVLGQSAFSLGGYAVVVGDAASATTNSVAVGRAAEAAGTNSVAIGYTSIISSTAEKAVALGYSSSVSHSNSIVIGTSISSTAADQILLGSGQWVDAGLGYRGPLATNATLKGTNIINGRVDFTSRANSGLANGNNAGVVLGTNVYIRMSGPTAAYTINGMAAEFDGSWHIVEFPNPVNSLTIADNSGTDPVAANRVRTGTGADVVFTNNPVVLMFIYNSTDARWKVGNWFR